MRARCVAATAALVLVLLVVRPSVGVMSARSSTSLVVWYQFSEGTGTSVGDSTGLWNTAVRNTRATWLASAVPSEPRGLLLSSACVSDCSTSGVLPTVAGSQSISSTADSPIIGTGDSQFGLDFWFRTANVTQNAIVIDAAHAIASGELTCTASAFRALSIYQLGTSLVVAVNVMADSPVTGTRYCLECVSGALAADALVHVALAWSSSAVGTLYVNGQASGCTAPPALLSSMATAWTNLGTNGQLSFGAKRTGTFAWTDARLYQFALYDDALSAAQVAQNYAAGPYNYVPVVTAFTASGLEDTPLTIALNATDPYDTTFTIVVASVPTSGALYQVTAGGAQGAVIAAPATVVTNALGLVMYVPVAHAAGATLGSFTFTADDGEAVSPAATVTLSLAAVNDAPTVAALAPTLAAPYATPTVVPGLSVADVDADVLTVTVHVTSGVLTIGTTSGLTFVVGDGVDDSAVRFRALAAQANAALASLAYESLLELGGTDTLVVAVADDTIGTAAAATASVTISVAAGC